MNEFIRKHDDRIHGVLSCFDRMLFRGYLPIMSGWAMAQFLDGLALTCSHLKPFLLENSERVKDHAIALAKKYERPFQYLASHIRKEDTARQLAERDGIEEGLVCIFSILEPCRTFSFRFQKGGPFVQSARRKCLHLYFYFMDRDFGLIHVRIQTWFPIQIQIYLNGHEWLARKLSANHVRYNQARQRLSLDRGYGQSAEVRRSLCEPELARDPEQVCQAGQSQMRIFSTTAPTTGGALKANTRPSRPLRTVPHGNVALSAGPPPSRGVFHNAA